MKIVVVVGNPKRDSRTLRVAHSLGRLIAENCDHGQDPVVIDLAEHARSMFEWPSAEMAALNETVASSDVAIIASPTYKASYTGLLKSFLDRYPAMGLADVNAVPVMTGAAKAHAMAPEVTLRPLLLELGATMPTRGLYFETPQFGRMDEVLSDWIGANTLGLLQLKAAAEARDLARSPGGRPTTEGGS